MASRYASPSLVLVALFALCAATGVVHAQTPGAGASDESADGRYIVQFHHFGPDAAAAVRQAGGRVALELPEQSALAAYLPPAAVAALTHNPKVKLIEVDARRYPMAQTTPYGIPMVQADQVSDSAALNRKVCIIDSGYSSGHEDLPTAGVSGTNDSGTGNWYEDKCAHGTHVAGTIVALNNSVGVVGVLPGNKLNLHIIKVFGDNCGWTYSSSLVAALNACRSAGANVVSMSLGGRFSSSTENTAFNNAYNAGVLSVAAAGNDGNTRHSYPASYDSVISVAAVDSAKNLASFSQRNNQVELAAPGVAVRSTVPTGTGTEESLTVDKAYEVVAMQGSPNLTRTGPLRDCGLGTSACPGGGGQVCLIQRGSISFADKVLSCQAGGGVAAVIYNNADPLFSGTLGSTTTTIPSVGTAGTTGAILLGKLGQSATVAVGPGHYSFFDGTSMATPHVSGVAALVWSHNTGWTNAQIRQALRDSAQDLGNPGRDDSYGYGLVQAKAALDLLNGGGTPNQPPTASFTASCSGLTCEFDASASTDDVGIVSYAWTFGDGASGSGQFTSRTYAEGGTYTVMLTVTDTDGATGTASQGVTVAGSPEPPPPAGFSLSATGYKVKGLQKADLSWTGTTSSNVNVFRDGALIATVANSGAYTDHINNRGGGSYTYQVCEAGATTCSNTASVIF